MSDPLKMSNVLTTIIAAFETTDEAARADHVNTLKGYATECQEYEALLAAEPAKAPETEEDDADAQDPLKDPDGDITNPDTEKIDE